MEKSEKINVQWNQDIKSIFYPTEEEGFDLKDCFDKIDDFQGYRKDPDFYFDSYSHFNIHEDMLKDKIRTNAYMSAITKNKHLFQNKIVMDVGCGTGILSIFAVRAGAKHVYAVEKANIVNFTKQIIADNNLADKITVINKKVEEIDIEIPKVDIIVSEFMGFALLYESMLDSVIFARDKYLVEGGLMFPDRATLFLSTGEDGQYRDEKIEFWENVYGVDMTCISKWVIKEPLVDQIDQNQINGSTALILDIDLSNVTVKNLDFSTNYEIKVKREDFIHCVILWFDVHFSHGRDPIRLSTSPFQKQTHWKQTLFYLMKPLPVFKNDILIGSIAIKKSEKNPRDLNFKLSGHMKNKLKQFDFEQFYKMN